MELSLCWKEAGRGREVREETQGNGYCLVDCASKGLRKPIRFYVLWVGGDMLDILVVRRLMSMQQGEMDS